MNLKGHLYKVVIPL